MRHIFGGAALLVAGVAAFIQASANAPEYGCPGGARICSVASPSVLVGGLSRTSYDLLRIGAWALVIFGALFVAVGLIRYARSSN